MSITFGFFDSLNHDRKYNSLEMGSIFDGIINDGIYRSIGDCFRVTEHSEGADMSVDVGSGRAWFNHTWTLNNGTLIVPISESNLVLDRIDAVVLEVNRGVNVRANSIKVVEGTPSSEPTRPDLTNDTDIHQYPLAYVYVAAAATVITNSNITDMVGSIATPYVFGVVDIQAESSKNISFDPVGTGLTSTDVQDAIDEVVNYIYNTYRRERRDITDLVKDGTFDKAIREQDFAKYGIAIGDYFKDSNNYIYYFADPNHQKGTDNGYTIADDHVALLVDTQTTSAYNKTSPVSGSFENYTIQTYLRGTILPKIQTAIASLTGDTWSDHLIGRKMLFQTVSGTTLNWGWSTNNEYITPMTETQVYGGPVRSAPVIAAQGEGVKKLTIFDKYRFNELFGAAWVWLRSLQSNTAACSAHNGGGYADTDTVTNAGGRVVGLILYKPKAA